jgi:hypothetical protein
MSAASGVSSTAQNYEQLSYGGAASQHRGQHRQVIADAVATRTLLPKEAGALCMFDRAAGVVYTLPAPVIGMEFHFATSVTITSNAASVVTDAATTFMNGGIWCGNSGAATGEFFAADGTTKVKTTSNGSTTGGIIGDYYTVTAISSTVWFVHGVVNVTGTAATPFA